MVRVALIVEIYKNREYIKIGLLKEKFLINLNFIKFII